MSEQPEAAHTASEVDDTIKYDEDDSIVLKILALLIALITLLAAWASVE